MNVDPDVLRLLRETEHYLRSSTDTLMAWREGKVTDDDMRSIPLVAAEERLRWAMDRLAPKGKCGTGARPEADVQSRSEKSPSTVDDAHL